MIDYFMIMEITDIKQDHIEFKIDGLNVEHNSKLKIEGGYDVYSQGKKFLFIFNDTHLHLYINITLEMIEKYMKDHAFIKIEFSNQIDTMEIDSIRKYPFMSFIVNTKYKFEFIIHLLNFIEMLEKTINDVIFRLNYKHFKRKHLLAILSSDSHGDLINFLLPLMLSGNMRIHEHRNIEKQGNAYEFLISSNPICICIMNGDYAAQDPMFYIKRGLNINIGNKVNKYLDETFLDFTHNFIYSTISVLIMLTRMSISKVYFNIGNHDLMMLKPIKTRVIIERDERLIKYDIIQNALSIIIILTIRNRIYLIQHGLINMFYPDCYEKFPEFSNIFFDTTIRIVYNPANLRMIYHDTVISISEIPYKSIESKLIKIDVKFIKTDFLKHATEISSNTRFLQSLPYRLDKDINQPMDLMRLYHFKSKFNGYILNEYIYNFLKSISMPDKIGETEAFLVLGHSPTLSELPFLSSYTSVDVSKDVSMHLTDKDTKYSIENTIFKNVLSLDNDHSFANDYIKKYINEFRNNSNKSNNAMNKPKGGSIENKNKDKFIKILSVLLLMTVVIVLSITLSNDNKIKKIKTAYHKIRK